MVGASPDACFCAPRRASPDSRPHIHRRGRTGNFALLAGISFVIGPGAPPLRGGAPPAFMEDGREVSSPQPTRGPHLHRRGRTGNFARCRRFAERRRARHAVRSTQAIGLAMAANRARRGSLFSADACGTYLPPGEMIALVALASVRGERRPMVSSAPRCKLAFALAEIGETAGCRGAFSGATVHPRLRSARRSSAGWQGELADIVARAPAQASA